MSQVAFNVDLYFKKKKMKLYERVSAEEGHKTKLEFKPQKFQPFQRKRIIVWFNPATRENKYWKNVFFFLFKLFYKNFSKLPRCTKFSTKIP